MAILVYMHKIDFLIHFELQLTIAKKYNSKKNKNNEKASYYLMGVIIRYFIS